MKKLFLPVLGALALAACEVTPQYEFNQVVDCSNAEANLATLAAAKQAVAADLFADNQMSTPSAEVSALLGGDYPDYAAEGRTARGFDIWRHSELREVDYRAACMSGAAS